MTVLDGETRLSPRESNLDCELVENAVSVTNSRHANQQEFAAGVNLLLLPVITGTGASVMWLYNCRLFVSSSARVQELLFVLEGLFPRFPERISG